MKDIPDDYVPGQWAQEERSERNTRSEEKQIVATKTGRNVLAEKAEDIEQMAEDIQEELGVEREMLKKPPTEAKNGKKPTPKETMSTDEWVELWNKRIDEYGPKVREAWNNIKPKVQEARVNTEEEFRKFLEKAEPKVKEEWKKIEPKLEEFGEKIGEEWEEEVEPKLEEAGHALKEKVMGAEERLKEIV